MNQLLGDAGANQSALVFVWFEVLAGMELSGGTGVEPSLPGCAYKFAARTHVRMQQKTGDRKEWNVMSEKKKPR